MVGAEEAPAAGPDAAGSAPGASGAGWAGPGTMTGGAGAPPVPDTRTVPGRIRGRERARRRWAAWGVSAAEAAAALASPSRRIASRAHWMHFP